MGTFLYAPPAVDRHHLVAGDVRGMRPTSWLFLHTTSSPEHPLPFRAAVGIAPRHSRAGVGLCHRGSTMPKPASLVLSDGGRGSSLSWRQGERISSSVSSDRPTRRLGESFLLNDHGSRTPSCAAPYGQE